MSDITGFRSADFRALQRRLVPRKAYSDKREYMTATKNIRDAIRSSSQCTESDSILVHELGHAVVMLHHEVVLDGLIVSESTEVNATSCRRLLLGACIFEKQQLDEREKSGQTQQCVEMFVAGIVSAFCALHIIDGEHNNRNTQFNEISDARNIARLLKLQGNEYENERKVHTVIMQSLLGIRVTPKLSAEHIHAIRTATQNAQMILHQNNDALNAMLNAAREKKNAPKGDETVLHAYIGKNDLEAVGREIKERRSERATRTEHN